MSPALILGTSSWRAAIRPGPKRPSTACAKAPKSMAPLPRWRRYVWTWPRCNQCGTLRVKLATAWRRGTLPPLHALICNAGVQSGAKQTFTADGFESTFGVNHLGHFLLVNLLLPRLAAPARVVVVSSGTHDPALKTGVPAPAWNDPMALAKGELGPLAAKDAPTKRGQRLYSTSKLANVLFTYELARRLPVGVTVNAFDPGLMPGTGLVRRGVRAVALSVAPGLATASPTVAPVDLPQHSHTRRVRCLPRQAGDRSCPGRNQRQVFRGKA